jgi:glucose-6-phosphate isomerase
MPIMAQSNLWQQYQQQRCPASSVGLSVDPSHMGADEAFWQSLAGPMHQALDAMAGIEAGEIANPDENRMVGHYWLRAPALAPSDDIAQAIRATNERIHSFAKQVHDKSVTPPGQARFTDVLLIGIGGSALGPQLVAEALGTRRDRMRMHFMDNTDPDGFQRTLGALKNRLKSTLVLVISKSGGTAETRNGMLETQQAFEAQGLNFAQRAVAITGEGSALDKQAASEGWLARFPMWDWVGGRTSVTSPVGLVPMALQGLDIDRFLEGAAEMDRITRLREMQQNPAAVLAGMWYHATGGKGAKDMVILPYKDRLLLMSRYLQQLVMESLGKAKDLDGQQVHQGIAVYGNKGSTDQHAFVQQLREGLNNFFVNFIVVREDVARPSRSKQYEVEPAVTSGDYLNGFYLGTRQALAETGRQSLTIECERLDAKTLGALIALYERAVGLYAELIHINAYHQPGVEAGKKAAKAVLELQKQAIAHLQAQPDERFSVEGLAQAVDAEDQAETLYHVLEHLRANKRYVKKARNRYQAVGQGK